MLLAFGDFRQYQQDLLMLCCGILEKLRSTDDLSGKRNVLWVVDHNRGRRQWHPTPVLLPGKSHGWRSLVRCSPWGRQESDTTERLHFDFSLSCIGEGNGNPLQYFCLENPRDGGAWWAAMYGVAQSRTQLTRLSSSSSSRHKRSRSREKQRFHLGNLVFRCLFFYCYFFLFEKHFLILFF